MKRLFTTIATVVIVTMFDIVGLTSVTVAQTSQAPTMGQNNTAPSLQVQGLGIDPFLIELELAPGGTVKQIITLTNTTNEPLIFSASINDFVTDGNSGQPLFLNSDEVSDPKYSLSEWITVTQQPQFTIPPQEQTLVELTISVPADAEVGTHYGGVLFGQRVGQIGITGPAVQHKAGAIIIVKLGQAQEKVQVTKFITQQNLYQHGPVEFLLSMHNFGNVHSKPKGDITIRNVFGMQVAQVPVNRDANIILPESARDFESVWENKLGFGRYTAETVMYYGNPKLELRAETSFWIVPFKELFLGVLITLILGIIGYMALKRYNRYIIKHSRDEN